MKFKNEAEVVIGKKMLPIRNYSGPYDDRHPGMSFGRDHERQPTVFFGDPGQGTVTILFQGPYANIGRMAFHYGSTAYNKPLGNDNSASVEIPSALLRYPEQQRKR